MIPLKEWTNGTPENNYQDGTQLDAADFESWHKELVTVLTTAGIAPDPAKFDQLNTALQAMLRGKATINVAGGANVVLSALQAQMRVLVLTGALTANISLIFPASSGSWIVRNLTTGAFTVTCKTAAGTGVAVSQGSNNAVFGDGTNVYAEQTDWSFSAGTAAAPGLFFSGDPDTGLYSPGANQIGVAVNGASALLIDAFRQAYHYATQFNALPGANNHYELVNRNGAGLTFFTNAAGRLAAHFDASGRLIMGGGTTPAAGYTGVGDITLPGGAGIRALNTCKAWAAVNPTTGAILEGVGFSTVTRVQAGLYTCTLANGLANNNYGVLGFSAGGVGETSFGVSENSGFTKTTSAFQIQTGNTESNAWVDAARLYIFVFGRDAA